MLACLLIHSDYPRNLQRLIHVDAVAGEPLSSGNSRLNWAIAVVGVLLVAAIAGWAITAAAPREAEMVEVWVAAQDLPVETLLRRADLNSYAVKKLLAKDQLPADYVMNEEDLLDSRLSRAMAKDEAFSSGALSKINGLVSRGVESELITFPASLAPGDKRVVPGSKIDVIAHMRINNQLKAFPILVDRVVVAIDTQERVNGTRLIVIFVSLNTTQKGALALELAKLRGGYLEVRLCQLGKPIDPTYDIDAVLNQLMELSDGPSPPGNLLWTGPIENPPPFPPARRRKD